MMENRGIGKARMMLGFLARDARAVTSLEYALIGALVMVAIVAAVTNYGVAAGGIFNKVGNTIAPKLVG